MNEFTMRFLIIGAIITILIGFGVWWFFIHSSSDRIVEENEAKFVEAVGVACETNQPVYVDFQMPQPFIASLKEKTEEFFHWVSQKIGLGGPEINIPVQIFNDPYYKIYWEYFPPEPPYSFGQGVLETAASIFAPWSEDLPWSSNFMLTLTFDTAFLGLDILGVKEVKEAITSTGRAAANKLVSKIASISPETFEKARMIWNAIEKGGDAVVENLGKAEKIVVKGGKLLMKEGRIVGSITTAYTIFCLATQDKTLEECAMEGVILGTGIDLLKISVQKFVWPKIKEKLAIRGASITLKELKSKFSSVTDETLGDTISSLGESNSQGWKYDKVTGKIIASSSDEVAKENIINPIEEYVSQTGYPNRIFDKFDIVYEYDEAGHVKGIKEVIIDRKGLVDILKEKILYPIEEKLGRLSENVMSDKMLTSNGIEEVSSGFKQYFEKNPEKAKNFLEIAGVKIKDSDEAVRILSTKLARIEDEASRDVFFVVMEKDSKLEKLMSALERGESKTEFLEGYLDKILIEKDSKEAKNLWNLLNGKRLRVKEDIEIFSRGTFGYMLLRIQDLYTPLGATYWDRYFSYYGYPSLEVQKKGFCRTQCEDGKVCVQLGACVRELDLPESCVNKGITSIKLKRDSIVAKDPRFYLVSPCYAKLKVYVDGDTIYVEPYMKIDDKKNYCYATAHLVNWYIGSGIGSHVARCVSASLCAVATAGEGGVGVLDVISACFGLGKGFRGACSIVSNLAGLLVDVFREGVLIYPDVYKNMPNLIDFKL
jgi:DNA-directed RNA polymerase subunit F